ncbi:MULTISPECIES: quinoprotein relay system zinc metallohydrolase 2 [Methylotenera]|uniref:quinoprotein relay system zinc metallohydrolase 2 n=1 Tax=Methylotenera TaxID=359407 RepID=UPI00039E713D|nr:MULTISPECIES: quinoprotein relay system zinc metallohydrolase 2 [Methylotenera]
MRINKSLILSQFLLLMLCFLALIGCVQADVKPNNFAIEDIGNGIYVHHGKHLDIDEGYQGDICNISFVVGERGVAVIDTGGSLKVGQQLREAIKKVTDKPILYVINTHVHPDHIFGNAVFLQDKPQFVGHFKLADAMQLRQEAYDKLNVRYLGEDAKGSIIVKPTLLIKAPTDLDLGGRTLKVTPFPNAHTNTDISVIDSKTGTLFTGDLLFIERTPVVEGDIKGLIAAIDVLKTYPAKQVVPGHGPVAKDWVAALNNEQRYLNALLTDIRAVIKNGGDMGKAMDTAAASEKDKWLLFDIANRRNVNTLYPALEWE